MIIGLCLTILTGLFFLIGIVILRKSKNKEIMSNFTIALAFVVMLGLLIFDLIPELLEAQNWLLLIPILIGLFILIILDRIIPHHHHEHSDNCDKLEHNLHLNHIGIITIIALTIHNLIEGITLYSVTLSSIKSGILMMISISLHNIPLGFQIGNAIKNRKNSTLLVILLCASSVIGALIFMAFGNINENILITLIALTFGMLLYILVFELFNELKTSIRKKESLYGIIVGMLILIIAFLI